MDLTLIRSIALRMIVSSILKSVQLLMATEEEEDDVEIDFDEPATYKHEKEEENFI